MSEEAKIERTKTVPIEDQLILATQRGSLDDCKRLLNNGQTPDSQDRNNSTPLFHCCSEEQIALARWFVSQGASVNHQNKRGNTPLHLASQAESKQVILLLMLHEADTNLTNLNAKKPEDMNKDSKVLIKALENEVGVFSILRDTHKKELTEVFEKLDIDKTGWLSLSTCVNLNVYLESVSEEVAKRDAEELLRDVSICRPGFINLEEWLFAFAKLAHENTTEQIDSFVEEFKLKEKEKGKFQDFKTLSS